MARLLAIALFALVAVPQAEPFKLTEEEQKLLDLTNAERAERKLPPLKASPTLFKVARAHSANMAKQGKMVHDLDGKTPFDRIKGAGYRYSYAGENIAAGDGLPLTDVMKAWMDSKVHRDNILEPQFSELGLGLAINDKNQVYYTQIFAKPRKD